MEQEQLDIVKERIRAFMREDAYRPLKEEELAAGLRLSGEETPVFSDALASLEADGAVIRNRSGLYGLPSRMNLVVGRLSMSPKGFGFIIPDVRETEDETDVFVPGGALATAMHGDRVVARVTPSEQPGRAREGEIIRILERANTRIVGTFERSKAFGFVTPDSAKIGRDVFVLKKDFGGAKTGSKVVVEITKWPEERRSAEGRVVEVLGAAGDPGVDVLAVMRAYDLDEKFPPEAAAAAACCPENPLPAEYEGRRDRRDFPIVTIDGEDTKDIDDGIYAYEKDGGFFLGVYIADVSHYVRAGEPLDVEAARRGTSVYLVDRVIPMLPKELSNGICSLNEGVDRLSMACEMEIGADGEVKNYEIVPCVIHVARRLTYTLVNKVLAGEEPFTADNADIRPMLETLRRLREALRAKRHRRGSIDFELPEVKVKLDAAGHPIGLVKRTGSVGESIIEECMLIANETVARHMELKEEPFVYRVHEQPNTEKIERFRTLLTALGLRLHVDEDGKVSSRDIQQVLDKVKGKPEERIIGAVALRSMQQARYSTQSLGHFGLAARYYTHFTSPIRRYPDLMVHRLLRETFATGHIPADRREKLRALLPETAEHSSARERIAVEAERETTDMKKIEYMAQFVGETYEGVVSGVTAFGIFVELDNGVEGLVHVSTMVNDYYSYVEEQYAMVGERTGTRYRLGDTVTIIITRADVQARTLDFVLKDNGVYDPNAVKKNAKQPTQKAQTGGGEKNGGRSRKKKEKGGTETVAAAESTPGARRKKTRGAHGAGNSRTKRGERAAKAAVASIPVQTSAPKAPAKTQSGSRPAKKGRRTERPRTDASRVGAGGGRSGDDRGVRDYHRVRVTGLNSAVWPDPPGYREQRTGAETAEKPRRAPRPARRMNRKTEGGTRSAD
ncbi:ribonuclease R [Selenomonas sp. F0473]|uniref:ribonuclease R n=1 Tax=Selenomonas sp. F0473 TaxID=999423 RepID=UPI0025F8757C|nr:ribonuclease R [Selenomonas sp. F0473]